MATLVSTWLQGTALSALQCTICAGVTFNCKLFNKLSTEILASLGQLDRLLVTNAPIPHVL
jgi:hypothetical protein